MINLWALPRRRLHNCPEVMSQVASKKPGPLRWTGLQTMYRRRLLRQEAGFRRRLLRRVPRAADGLHLCVFHPSGANAGARARPKDGHGLPEAHGKAGRSLARHRLRVGNAGHARRPTLRRAEHRSDPQQEPSGLRKFAHRLGGEGRNRDVHPGPEALGRRNGGVDFGRLQVSGRLSADHS